MPNDDLVIVDEDVLDEKPYYPLAFRYVEDIRRRPQSREECGQRFSEAQVGGTVGRLIDDRLQFGVVRLFAPPQVRHAFAQFVQREKTFLIGGEQSVDAFTNASEIASEGVFTAFGRVGLARGCEPSVDFVLDKAGIFEQSHDFRPHHLVKKILTHRAIGANRTGKPPPRVGAETAIIMDPAGARSRRCAIEGVSALAAAHETLHDAGRDSPPRRVSLVGLEPFLREREGVIADDRRNGDRDPILPRPLVVRTVTRRDAATQPYRPGDPLTRRQRRLAKASLAFVRRITQHAPDRRTFPPATSLAGGDCLVVQEAGNGANAETFNGVQFEHPPHNPSLLFVNLIVRRRMVRLADKSIPERSAAQHADFALASTMSFATARALQNLCAFVLRDHALELHEQFVLWRRTARRTYKQGLDAGACELLDQKDLVRVSSTQAGA